MKKYFNFKVFIALLFGLVAFSNLGSADDKKSYYEIEEGLISNSVGIYASSPSAISINGLDAFTDLATLKKIYGAPDDFDRRYATYYWGKLHVVDAHYLFFDSGAYGLNPTGRRLGIYGNADIGLGTPDGVKLGMPFTEAQKIYGLREDYGIRWFYVISRDHSKYMTITRTYKPNKDGIYTVESITIELAPDKSIINTIK